jgi:hypothetical protein
MIGTTVHAVTEVAEGSWWAPRGLDLVKAGRPTGDVVHGACPGGDLHG